MAGETTAAAGGRDRRAAPACGRRSSPRRRAPCGRSRPSARSRRTAASPAPAYRYPSPPAGGGPAAVGRPALRQRLGLAHRKPVLDDPLGQPGRIGCRDQRARMAGRQRAVDQHVADHVRQLEQPQRVGDMAAALADDLAEIGLRIVVLVDQLLVAQRLFDRIEVGALDVLDDREFERRPVVDVADDAPGFRSGRRAARRASDVRRR